MAQSLHGWGPDIDEPPGAAEHSHSHRDSNHDVADLLLHRIRRHVGRDAFVMPAAGALVQDDGGRVLFMRRTDNREWAFPGGAMELGERIDQTVVNEVYEETGLRVEPVRLIGVYSDQLYWVTYPNGDQLRIVSALFQCQIVGGEVRPDGLESSDVRFFLPHELPPISARNLCRLRDGLANRDEIVL